MSVLDASVVLKWFINEEDSDKAEILRSEYFFGNRSITVPDLILYEFANALNFNPEFDTDEIKEAIQTLFDMEIEIITPTQMMINKAVDIASKNNVTIYDASYLALSYDLQVEFITADEKFYKKLFQSKFKDIVLLKEIKL